MDDLIQNIDATPFIAASWILSGVALGVMSFWVWRQWMQARRNLDQQDSP